MIFKGRKVIVTGGSRGIGRAIALEFAEKGADVAVMAKNLELCEEVASSIRKKGRDAIAFSVDISDFSAVSDAVRNVIDRWGVIDFLINNAGIVRDAILLRMSHEDWNSVIAVNLSGTFNFTKAVLRDMVQARWGRIVNITSIIGATGAAGQANYAASKAGIIGFTKSCAKEVASRGITINAVAPGFIETDMTGGIPEKNQKEILKNIPMRRFGKPEDVSGVVSFLCSPQGDYITGQVLHVNGGLMM